MSDKVLGVGWGVQLLAFLCLEKNMVIPGVLGMQEVALNIIRSLIHLTLVFSALRAALQNLSLFPCPICRGQELHLGDSAYKAGT